MTSRVVNLACRCPHIKSLLAQAVIINRWRLCYMALLST